MLERLICRLIGHKLRFPKHQPFLRGRRWTICQRCGALKGRLASW